MTLSELGRRFDEWLFGWMLRFTDRPKPPPVCSFCRKPEGDVGMMVEGPGRV